MDELHSDTERASSFDGVVNAYDMAWPSYPSEAARWLTGPERATVLELGAGTGKLTERLVAAGHTVTATDPSGPMLRRLAERVPGAQPVLAVAGSIPARSGSVDIVVAAQAFHGFDAERVLPEIARVLKARGVVGLLRNDRDERIPWVRRLGAIIGDDVDGWQDPVQILDDSGLFETVQTSTFRFWQPATRQSLRDLALSRPNVAMLSPAQRDPILRKVEELYDEYGRGHDGMLLPYVTRAYRTIVLPWAVRQDTVPAAGSVVGSAGRSDQATTDSLLIDFH